MKLATKTMMFALGFANLLLAGCAEWRTTPEAVDQRWGMSVRKMIDEQTLYPEHGETETQVLLIDGRRADGVLGKYRTPANEDYRKAREPVEIKFDSSAQ